MRNLNCCGRAMLLLVGVCSFVQACTPMVKTVTHVYKRDITAVSSLSALNLSVPSGGSKKADTSYMVAFVAPAYEAPMQSAIASMRRMQQQYAEDVARLQQSGQQQQGQAMLLALQQAGSLEAVGQLYRKVDVAKADYLDQVKKTLQKDLEQILLSKNIRVSGPFPSRDEMTFDEKKRAIYTFTPEIFVAVDTKPKIPQMAKTQGYHEEGDVIVSGRITLTLRESITGEKLWVKRLEADPVSKPYTITAKYKHTYQVQSKTVTGLALLGVIPLTPSDESFEEPSVVETDNSDQVLASALSNFYAGLGDKLWRHIDPEEWGKYLDQAEQLRKEKRF